MKTIQKVLSLVLALMLLIPAAYVAGEGTNPSVTAKVIKISKDGTISLDLDEAAFAAAGIHINDIVTVTLNGRKLDMPMKNSYDYSQYRQPFIMITKEYGTELATRFGSFLSDLGFATQVEDGDGYKWVWAEGTTEPETVLIELKEAGGYKPVEQKVGILTLLNLSNDALAAYVKLSCFAASSLINSGVATLNSGAPEYLPCDTVKVVSYDTLNTLLLGLNSGEVNCALVSECVADYICNENDSFIKQVEYSDEEDLGYLNNLMYRTITNDYALMFYQDKAEMKDEINAVLKEMKEDGTLDILIQTYIANATNEATNHKVEFEQFDGAETIRFIVTGDMPPMDYVTVDETPTGFSTAVLAEIGKRLQKNVQVIVGENLTRALELQNGHADAAFWTRSKVSIEEWTNSFDPTALDEQEKIAKLGVARKRFSVVVSTMTDEMMLATFISDIPENLLTTDPYYSDPMVLIYRVK